MLDPDQIAAASRILRDHWRAGTKLAALEAPLRPRDRAEAYAIQAAIECYADWKRFGWKIAATSEAGQKHINVDGPMAGRILSETVIPDGGTASMAGNEMRVGEPEFAFRMAKDLPPRSEPYTVREVLDVVGTLHPAIEIPDSRFADFVSAGAAQIIADNACAHLFVLGSPTAANWRALDLIETLPSTPALRREAIKLQVALITPLTYVRGPAALETKAAAERAQLKRLERFSKTPSCYSRFCTASGTRA